MPAYSVYCSDEESSKLRDKAMSPSKAFTLGIEVASLGGMPEVANLGSRIKDQEKKIAYLTDQYETERRLSQEKTQVIIGLRDQLGQIKKDDYMS